MDDYKELLDRLTRENRRLKDLTRSAGSGLKQLREELANYEQIMEWLSANGFESFGALTEAFEQVKREKDAAVEFTESIVRNGANPCEGCKADCIDAGSDEADYTGQCGHFTLRGPQKEA